MKENKVYEKEIDVLGASKYNFTNDNGEVIQGCKISVLSQAVSENSVGSQITQINLDFKEFNKFEFVKFPCKCLIRFTITDFNRRPRIESIDVR